MVAAPPPPSVFEFPKHPLVAGKTASVDQRPPCSMFRPGEISKSDASSSRKGCASRTFSPLYVRPGRGTNVPLKNTLKSSAPKGQITFFFRGLSGVHGRGAPLPLMMMARDWSKVMHINGIGLKQGRLVGCGRKFLMARENFSLGRTHRGVYLHLAPLGCKLCLVSPFIWAGERGERGGGRGSGFVEVVK